jgi:hypothetical protein
LRGEDLRALVNFELGMIEQDGEAIEEGAADLIAVLGAPAHPAHQTVGALGGDPPRGRLGVRQRAT